MVKYIWAASLAVAFALVGTGVQEASAQYGYGGHHHGHHGYQGYHTGYRGYNPGYGRLPVYNSGYGGYYGQGYPAYGVSRSTYYSGGSFPSTLGPYGGLGGYGNYGYLSHQPAPPRVQPRFQLRIGF